MNVGIDAIGLALPSLSLDLTTLARARGVDPAKYVEGLGTVRMSIPPFDEDTVTLAVRAAQDALEAAGCSPRDIGLCVVGTETAVDHSKPVASFVQSLVGLPNDCRIFETKHACYGGTAALHGALDWIRAGSARGRKALVICSDIARYGLRTPGEPTQGAGAVALLVGEQPRLLDFQGGIVSTYSEDVFDFWRPLYSKDAVVDGHYSVTCYLKALEVAYGGYVARSRDAARGAGSISRASSHFAAMAYHVPYPKMAIKAHRQVCAVDGEEDPQPSFQRLVAPGLALPKLVGNIYTGSLYLALASLLSESPDTLDDGRIAMFSYGSGSCAEFFDARVVPGAQALVAARAFRTRIEAQRVLGMDEYESILSGRESLDERPFVETMAGAPSRTARGPKYLGVRDHKRTYAKG